MWILLEHKFELEHQPLVIVLRDFKGREVLDLQCPFLVQ
jgi:hypothetical protein